MSGERGGGVVAKTAAQTGQEVVLSERLPSELPDPKFTAAQIEKDCPARLHDLAKEITEGLEKVYEQEKLADDQVIAVKKLIAEVKALCDVGGFAAFREKFFPNLGKSRVYELLAIATNKKSVEEARASNRKRLAKHRANKAEAPNSVTVTENLEPDRQIAPEEHRKIEAPSIASAQTPEPTKPRSSDRSSDGEISRFDTYVMELWHKIAKHNVEHFLSTPVLADDLAKVGKFLSDLAALKKSKAKAINSAPIVALPNNGTVSVGQPAVAADDAVLPTSADPVA
jgi:hypothetical protein